MKILFKSLRSSGGFCSASDRWVPVACLFSLRRADWSAAPPDKTYIKNHGATVNPTARQHLDLGYKRFVQHYFYFLTIFFLKQNNASRKLTCSTLRFFFEWGFIAVSRLLLCRYHSITTCFLTQERPQKNLCLLKENSILFNVKKRVG